MDYTVRKQRALRLLAGVFLFVLFQLVWSPVGSVLPAHAQATSATFGTVTSPVIGLCTSAVPTQFRSFITAGGGASK